MTIGACLFDLDGVIVDTAKYHYLAWKALADQLGIHFTKRDNEQLKGISRMDSLEILLHLGNKTGITELEKKALAQRKNCLYLDWIKHLDPSEVLPGVLPFLKQLKLAGIAIGLGSASKNAPFILNRLKIEDLFDTVIDGNSLEKAKPHPEVFLLGAKQLGISPKECVVFEDAQSGIEAALKAGMYCVGIGDSQLLKDAHWIIGGFQDFDLETLQENLNRIAPKGAQP